MACRSSFMVFSAMLLTYNVSSTNVGAGIAVTFASPDDIVDTMEKTNEQIDKYAGIMAKGFEYMDISDFADVLGYAGPICQGIGMGLQFIAMFMPKEDSPELQAIKKGFKRMEQRFDAVERKLKQLETHISLEAAASAYLKTHEDLNYLRDAMLDAGKRGNEDPDLFTTLKEQCELHGMGKKLLMNIERHASGKTPCPRFCPPPSMISRTT